MPAHRPQLTIAPVTERDLPELLPLMRDYCAFYAVSPAPSALGALSLALISDPDRHGLQLIARPAAGAPLGFATLFWTWDTLAAGEIAVMNDLYVVPAARGGGVGRALVDACSALCRARGVARMDWQTAPDNERAQRLYDTLGAEREDAVVYALTLARLQPAVTRGRSSGGPGARG